MDPSTQAPAGQPYSQGQPYPTSQPSAAPYAAGSYQQGQPGYQQQQPTIVVAQPSGTSALISVPRPPDYMIPSILACIFCFWPTGLAAIYYSSRTNSMVSQGNMSEAERYSTTARYLLITTVVVGVIWIVIVIAVRVSAASASS